MEMGMNMERDHTALHGGEVAAAALLAGIMLGAPQPALAQEDCNDAQTQATAVCAEEPNTQADIVASDDGTASAPIAHAATQEPATSEEGASGADSGDTATGQNAAETQPAASSDGGTYEDAGLYQVAVRYVNAQGEEIAPTAYAVGYEGEWSVQSPALDGYTLVDPGQSTVSGTFSGEDHDPVVTVTYKNSLAKYAVIYERKVADGYEVMERVEKDPAEIGSTVSASTPSFAGYHCVATEDELTATVTSDGLATIVVRYEPDSQSRTIFFETGGGTYVEPITGQEGDAVEGREDPTRPGYTFAGWDTDGDGTSDALPPTMPDSDVTATALWAPAQAAYTVEIYGENKGSDGYHLIGTIENLIGKTESPIAGTDPEDPLFDPLSQLDESQGNDAEVWQYYQRPSKFLGTSVRWEGDATIKGDGSSVAKAYYDWRWVTIHFMDLDPDKFPTSSAPVWGYCCSTDQVKEISSIKVKPFTSIEFPNAITAQLKGEAEDGQDYQKNGSWYPLTFMYWAPFERTGNTSFKSNYSRRDVINTFASMGYSRRFVTLRYSNFHHGPAAHRRARRRRRIRARSLEILENPAFRRGSPMGNAC